MLDHGGRRRLLYSAVTLLEPYACVAIIQHYVIRRHDLILPILRIYVDLERMVWAGRLVRHIRPRLGGEGTTFFWETPGLVLVEPEPPKPRWLVAHAPLLDTEDGRLDVSGDGADPDIAFSGAPATMGGQHPPLVP